MIYRFFTIVISLLLTGCEANATTYYFSDLQGDDNRSSTEARHPVTPWKSLKKLNDFFSEINQGDSILFKAGEIYFGFLKLQNRHFNRTVYIGSFGNGAKPVFSGLSVIHNWTDVGNGMWKTILATVPDLQIVMLNGVVQSKGRFPNKNANRFGYLIYQHCISDKQITGAEPLPDINWEGAEVVIHKNDFIIDRNLVTSQAGSTINYASSSPYSATEDYGYFFQNHISALDESGEWCLNSKTKELTMFFGSLDPLSQKIQVALQNTMISFSNISNVVMDGIALSGVNADAIAIHLSNHITIENCNISFSGINGIFIRESSFVKIDHTVINDSCNDGLYSIKTDKIIISNNKMINSGMISGMGGNGGDSYQGIIARGNNITITGNEIDSTGYNAIHFEGDSVEIADNHVNYFDAVKNDGGGIYTWVGSKDPKVYEKRRVSGNIISDGITNDESNKGVGSFGIYLDQHTMNVELLGNNISHCSNGGIYLHNVNNISVMENKVFENKIQLFIRHDKSDPFYPNRLLKIMHNHLKLALKEQQLLYVESISNDLSEIGTIDSNEYCFPEKGDYLRTVIREFQKAPEISILNFDQWKQVSGYDSHSSYLKCP